MNERGRERDREKQKQRERERVKPLWEGETGGRAQPRVLCINARLVLITGTQLLPG